MLFSVKKIVDASTDPVVKNMEFDLDDQEIEPRFCFDQNA